MVRLVVIVWLLLSVAIAWLPPFWAAAPPAAATSSAAVARAAAALGMVRVLAGVRYCAEGVLG